MENVTLKVLDNNESYRFHGFAKDLVKLGLLRIVRVKDENYDFESICHGVFEGVFGDTDEDEKLEVELQKEEHRHYVERVGVYDYSVEVRESTADEWKRINTVGGSCGVGDEIYETSVDKDLLEDGVNWLAKKVKFG